MKTYISIAVLIAAIGCTHQSVKPFDPMTLLAGNSVSPPMPPGMAVARHVVAPPIKQTQPLSAYVMKPETSWTLAVESIMSALLRELPTPPLPGGTNLSYQEWHQRHENAIYRGRRRNQ